MGMKFITVSFSNAHSDRTEMPVQLRYTSCTKAGQFSYVVVYTPL